MSTTFGTYLRELRAKQGTTARHLADLLDMSEHAVLRWEKGLTEPSIRGLQKCMDILHGDIMHAITLIVADTPKEE